MSLVISPDPRSHFIIQRTIDTRLAKFEPGFASYCRDALFQHFSELLAHKVKTTPCESRDFEHFSKQTLEGFFLSWEELVKLQEEVYMAGFKDGVRHVHARVP